MSFNTEDSDRRILGYLENIEQERLNFGLYETYVTKAEILDYAQKKGEELNELVLEEGLVRLDQQWWVLKLDEHHYRSRISEIVRLLKNVKQRFNDKDIHKAPYLIQSIRVEFADRKRLKREDSFKDTIKRLFEKNRHCGLNYLDQARKAVTDGFCKALKKEVDEVKLTRVQHKTLLNITQKYFERKGQGYVITGNTGSGKTEAALLPLLIGSLQEKMEDVNGCKIILVYPRQTLAKNQLERVTHYIASINQEVHGMRGVSKRGLTVGIAFGDTPFTDEELSHGNSKFQRDPWDGYREGYKLPYFTDKNGDPVAAVNLVEGVCTLKPADGSWELEGFKATREAIQSKPPDILIITTEMLHRWLLDSNFNDFFGLPYRQDRPPDFCAPRAVVFDEIHLYDTIHGAQIGLLIRRLRYRLQQAMKAYEQEAWKYPLMLGMSATIGNAKKFWKMLSGVPSVDEISPQDEDLEKAQGREYFLFIRPETYSRGKPVGDASTAIQTIMAIAHNMRRRAGNSQEPPKFRSLVFQDSISKVKKLALEFYDAETNKNLGCYRLQSSNSSSDVFTSTEFLEGEYWYFDAEDPDQYSTRRTQPETSPKPLTSKPFPVYSGGGKGDVEILQQDIIFATTALEVGYDDASIQFVLQHHAPRNAASFVQKKGRAGRSLQDRPITAFTLSQHSYKDAFYYQNPQLLYNPSDYRPPLNVDNYFVQQFNTRQLLEDKIFSKLGNKPEIFDYLMDNLIHSLKQATRNLFLTEGSTRDQEVGSHSVLKLTYGKKPWDTSFYVYERNQDGSGATRLASEVLSNNPIHLLKRWWEVTLSCPVGDEEDFLKKVLRDNADALLNFQEIFFQSDPKDRENPRNFLFSLVEQQVKNKNDSLLQRLAGLLTSKLSIAGQTLPRIGVQIELLLLEDVLAERFKRPPTPRELAGYVAGRVEQEPEHHLYLHRLMQMYKEHTQNLSQEDEDSDDTTNALDRFLAQIEQISLSTCIDACPACLAATCDHGHIDVMRHTISRRYLNKARRFLTQELTRQYGQEPVEDLVAIANQNGGYIILEYCGQPDSAYMLELKNQGFEMIKRDFDHETFVVRQMFYYRGDL